VDQEPQKRKLAFLVAYLVLLIGIKRDLTK
jgi:hypothetical protein